MSRRTILGAIITPDGKRFPLRQLTPYRARQILKPYARSIGAIAFHWNWLHENLAKLFELIVKPPSPQMAHAIWYAVENDYTQRKMLRETLKHASHLTNQQKETIAWLLKTIDEAFRHKRNAAIHAPLMFATGVVDDLVKTWIQANVWSQSPRAKELLKTGDLSEELEHYEMIAERLSDFSNLVYHAISTPSKVSWPERPDLQRKPRRTKARRETR